MPFVHIVSFYGQVPSGTPVFTKSWNLLNNIPSKKTPSAERQNSKAPINKTAM